MANEKKFLDQTGVQYLWSQLSLHDYPNNETLVAVINAIDETKADAEHTHTLSNISDVAATADEINILNGVTTTTTEINYLSGVTSAIQSQFDAVNAAVTAITNDEIDAICGASIAAASEVTF